MSVTGIVLAAGAGRRAGFPKALARTPDGTPWLELAVAALAPCDRVVVVLGAALDVPTVDAEVVVAADWATGQSASLRAGLAAATGDAALVTLVDYPRMPVAAAERMLRGAGRTALAQATYRGRPGHPVLLGAEHWPSLAASLEGDRGARAYLRAHGALEVRCDDLWDGEDDDRPGATPAAG